MKTSPVVVPPNASPRVSASMPPAARAVLSMLESLQHGQLELRFPNGQTARFGSHGPQAVVRLFNWRPFIAATLHGDVGFAESFIDGDWDTPALDAVLNLVVANRSRLEPVIYGSWFGRLLQRWRHLSNRNSRAGSRRNIHAHYDLGNAFYQLWLDPGMTYSSALFDNDAARSLESAQQAKYRRILDALQLGPGAEVLEIGCGWGGFAELACDAGLRIKGLTLSTEQLARARERLDRAGHSTRATLALQDYRDETGRYDGIVSIEMFEAVGEAYWPTYFATLRETLRAGGRAVIQTITIDDALFERYRRGSDFIQQYVFPGGMLPSPSAFEKQAGNAGLRVIDRHRFGADYATTLQCWRERFLARLPDVRQLGFDDRFIRTWEFYLAYCEAGFGHGNCDVVQYTLAHREPGCRQ